MGEGERVTHALHPRQPLGCPAQAANKEGGPSKGLAPLLGGLRGLRAHPECVSLPLLHGGCTI